MSSEILNRSKTLIGWVEGLEEGRFTLGRSLYRSAQPTCLTDRFIYPPELRGGKITQLVVLGPDATSLAGPGIRSLTFGIDPQVYSDQRIRLIIDSKAQGLNEGEVFIVGFRLVGRENRNGNLQSLSTEEQKRVLEILDNLQELAKAK